MVGLSLFTLENIKPKVRRLTGHLSTQDLDDTSLTRYINQYYQLKFVVDARPKELRTWFQFDLTASTSSYSLDTTENTYSTTEPKIFNDGFVGIEQPITADGYDILLFQDPGLFYDKWPEVTTYDEGRPEDVLYFDKTLLFRYPPDNSYTIKFATWRRPPALSADGDYPMMESWGNAICYGSALEIASDYGDQETIEKLDPFYSKHLADIGSLAHYQNVNTRSLPRF